MKRVIKDYKTISFEMLQLLMEKYPFGVDEEDLISFTTPKGYKIKAVELKTNDAIYLIKMSSELTNQLSSFIKDREGIDPYSDGYGTSY
ncbi:MAG: hypothetical protein ACEPOZ_18540 [Marinifilaceae bacterium]